MHRVEYKCYTISKHQDKIKMSNENIKTKYGRKEDKACTAQYLEDIAKTCLWNIVQNNLNTAFSICSATFSWCWWCVSNTLMPRQNDNYFVGDILKCFLNENARLSIKISMDIVP